MKTIEFLNKRLKFNEVDAYIERKIHRIFKLIDPKEDDSIHVNRILIDEDNSGVIHDIDICPSQDLVDTPKWDGSEMFTKKGNELFLYLKGRLLIQSTTLWVINEHIIDCSYIIEE